MAKKQTDEQGRDLGQSRTVQIDKDGRVVSEGAPAARDEPGKPIDEPAYQDAEGRWHNV